MFKSIELKAGKEAAVKRRHPWVFSGAVQSPINQYKNGDFVTVLSNKKEKLGTGYIQQSSIAIRMLDFGNSEWSSIESLFQKKIKNALSLRQALPIDHQTTNAYRLIHGEGDELSGLVVDRFDDVLVVQLHSVGLVPYLETIADILFKELKPTSIVVKSKTTVQDGKNEVILGTAKDNIEIKENNRRFIVSPLTGQKTGFFLDQRENRDFIQKISNKKKVLNLFSYSGGFSVAALMGGATHVTSVDSSKHAAEFCEKNIELNGFKNHTSKEEDVFDFLKASSEKFDIVVCDPPAFAKQISAERAAIKGYAKLNRAVIEKVAPRGILATFSCSQVVSSDSFRSAITSACIEGGRAVRIIHQFSQSACHPESIFHPEGRYLKGLLLQFDY